VALVSAWNPPKFDPPTTTPQGLEKNSFGYGFGIASSFQAHSSSKPDQMSPIHAADRIVIS
jgi:hypothetical protein